MKHFYDTVANQSNVLVPNATVTVFYSQNPAPLASDNFNRADNLSLGPNWTLQPQPLGVPCQISAQQVELIHLIGQPFQSYMAYTALLPPNDHYSQIAVVNLLDGNSQAGVLVRANASTGACYQFLVQGPLGPFALGSLRYFDSLGNGHLLGAGTFNVTLNANSVIRLEVLGTTLTCKVDGVVVSSVVDTNLASGYAGFSLGIFSGTDVTTAIVDNWAVGIPPALVGTLAPLFSDDGLTPTTNPVFTKPAGDPAVGTFSFYVADGRYDLQISGNNVSTITVHNVEIADITEAGPGTGDAAWQTDGINFVNQNLAPSTPSSGTVTLYTLASNKHIFIKDDTGTITDLGTGGGGGGSPGGVDTSVQINNSGSFGGDGNFTYDPTGLITGDSVAINPPTFIVPPTVSNGLTIGDFGFSGGGTTAALNIDLQSAINTNYAIFVADNNVPSYFGGDVNILNVPIGDFATPISDVGSATLAINSLEQAACGFVAQDSQSAFNAFSYISDNTVAPSTTGGVFTGTVIGSSPANVLIGVQGIGQTGSNGGVTKAIGGQFFTDIVGTGQPTGTTRSIEIPVSVFSTAPTVNEGIFIADQSAGATFATNSFGLHIAQQSNGQPAIQTDGTSISVFNGGITGSPSSTIGALAVPVINIQPGANTQCINTSGGVATWGSCAGTVGVQALSINTSPVTVNANTSSAQTLQTFATAPGLLNTLGRTLRFKGYGTLIPVNTTVRVPVWFALTAFGSGYGGATIPIGTSDTYHWVAEMFCTTTTTGVTGALQVQINFRAHGLINGAEFGNSYTNTLAGIDLTAAVGFQGMVQFIGTASTSNSCTQNFTSVEQLN